MRKYFRVLYYHYYLVYTRYIPDPSPRGTTVSLLGFSIGCILYPIFTCLNVFIKIYPLKNMNPVLHFILPAIFCSFLIFYHKSIHSKIIKEKPILFNNKRMTIIIVIVYTLFSWASIMIGLYLQRKFIDYI